MSIIFPATQHQNQNAHQLTINSELLSKSVRQKRGKDTLRSVSIILGMACASINRVEHGQTPDLRNYVRFCRWLEKPLEFFLKEEYFVHPDRVVVGSVFICKRINTLVEDEVIKVIGVEDVIDYRNGDLRITEALIDEHTLGLARFAQNNTILTGDGMVFSNSDLTVNLYVKSFFNPIKDDRYTPIYFSYKGESFVADVKYIHELQERINEVMDEKSDTSEAYIGQLIEEHL